MKLGSLFDGSGGFPLAGSLCGIEPVWASEVEPYPIAVTRSRFPKMKHLGDISKVNGGEIEPVDVITFGSPCQDLSVAGKRAGLKHEANGDEETTRSGLFMEAVRIIKEMREKTDGRYPTFALWENVPGAFSSNNGEDFRIVCEELIKIVEPTAVMPAVPKNGWAYADLYMGDGWSLAYRVFDAQYWGVPQRRRRIHLVLDLRGERAGEILFEREGVRGYFETGRTPWQATAGDAQDCAGADDRAPAIAWTYRGRENGCNIECQTEKAYAIRTPSGGGSIPYVAVPVNTIDRHAVAYAIDQQGGKGGANYAENVMPTICSDSHGTPHAVAYAAGFKPGQGAKARSIGYEEEKTPTLASEAGETRANELVEEKRVYESHPMDSRIKELETGVCPTVSRKWHKGAADTPLVVEKCHAVRYIVRRLTPTECARLQGFADRWGDIDKKDAFTAEEFEFWHEVRNTHATMNGKKVQKYTEAQMLSWYNKLHTDSAEYKMWGNGIALPPALYVMQGIKETEHE